MKRRNGFRKLRFALLSLPLLALSSMVQAVPIYDINRTIGIGSVTGTLETDGTLGILDVSNFIDWDITLFDGNTSFNLLTSNSSWGFFGGGFSATATDLFFDFGSTGFQYALLQSPFPGSGVNFWCLYNSDTNCSNSGGTESVGTAVYALAQSATSTGVMSVGTVSQIPEPSSIALLGIGIAAFGAGSLKRRNKK